MSAPAYLIEGAIYLTAAVIAVPLFKRLGLGSILGYLIAGIIIGPSALQLISDPERVIHFAEFGVVMLLFLIGLELEPKQAWRLRKPIFGLGGLQVVATLAVAFGAAVAMGFSWQVALVAAMGIAMSSTAIGLATLQEKRLMGTPGGEASFAVLLFQDLSVIPLFMVLALLAPAGASQFNWRDAVAALTVIGAIIVASRTLLRPLMRIVAQTGMREIFVAFALLLVVGVALAVQWVGLSMALGTFLAGVLLADSEYRYELQLDIEPAKGLLLGLFFIAVGMSVDVQLVLAQPLAIVGLALLVVAIKVLLLFGLARLFSIKSPDARLFAVGLSQIGEFAFVFFGLALTQGTLDRPTYNALNAIVAVSMLLTPLLFALCQRLGSGAPKNRDDDEIHEKNPVIVAGFGRFGQIIVRVLNARGFKTTLVDHDPNQVDLLRSFGWQVYYGDAGRLDLLEQAGIAEAKLFVIAIDDPEAAVKLARIVGERWPRLPIVARARSRTDAYEFRDLGLHAVRETFHSSLEAATQALRALGEPAHSAWRMARQFEQHDLDILERTHRVRHDRDAVMSLSEQGRKDLQALLAHERLEAGERSGELDEAWAHTRPPYEKE
ncbi:MAG TPA: monovalent cation:proton antiporter-2 (CPA2) family protein [Spongiibacteraceae bacterium]|nr:monovalent cation:proton antiporter-2 (CPA2) family protein [Spongiibacteraceae bacterium]